MKNYVTFKSALRDLLFFISEHSFSYKYVLIINELNCVFTVD
jgi:hypothetical protein